MKSVGLQKDSSSRYQNTQGVEFFVESTSLSCFDHHAECQNLLLTQENFSCTEKKFNNGAMTVVSSDFFVILAVQIIHIVDIIRIHMMIFIKAIIFPASFNFAMTLGTW